MKLAGLDIGTTGCKISVFDSDGTMLGNVYRNYPVLRGRSAHEVDASALWTAVQDVMKQAAAEYPGIGGIGVASFGETFVLLDEKDVPLFPALLNTDPRGEAQCARLVELLGRDELSSITGLNPNAIYSLPKLMWLKENEPDLFKRAKRALLMEDYIVYMLTGNAQIDYSLAARTMAFDIRHLCWSDKILDAASIEPTLFAKPVPTGSSAGTIKAALARQLGISPTAIVVSVSHDQVAAAIGSGVFDESHTVDGAGTVQCNTPVFSTCDVIKMTQNNYCIVPFLESGKFVTYAFSYTGGALIQWFVENFAADIARQAGNEGKSVNRLLEGDANDAPTGILVLPHFSGAATPYMDGGSKGCFLGLTLSHTRQDLYRAVMEGVCYEMRLNQERLAEAGVRIAPLHATGGGARSSMWMQMKADVLNVPVTAMETIEAGATGSAMLVGVATGAFQTIKAAAAVLVKEGETFYPRKEMNQKFEAVYQRYQKIYSAVRPLL